MTRQTEKRIIEQLYECEKHYPEWRSGKYFVYITAKSQYICQHLAGAGYSVLYSDHLAERAYATCDKLNKDRDK